MPNLLTLADPANFGNKPGDGPLRPGGKEGGLPMQDKDLPSTLSKAAQRQAPDLALVRDLWQGQRRMQEMSAEYLPKAPGEDAGNYAVRVKRSAFHNFYRRTVEGLVGLVFRKDPKLGEDVPPAIRRDWENIDNAGTHGDVFAREIMQDALVAGHAAILVEFPATGGTQGRREEFFEGKVRPYWIPIQKEHIRSWRTTVEDGRQVLTQVVLREETMVPDGLFGEKKQTRYRVLYRGDIPLDGKDPANGTRRQVGYILLEETEKKEVVTIDAGTYPTQEEIPLVEVPTSGRRSLFDSDPPLLDVAHLNVAHYQQYSDYAYSIYKTCVPILVTLGLTPQIDTNGEPVDLVIGPNSGIDIPNPEGDAKYISHDGASLGEAEKALENLKNDIGTLGLAMLAPQKRSAETAEAKRLDKAASDSALSVTARALQDALERALAFHARYLRLEDGGSIEINRDFEGLLMDADVMRAYAILVKEAGFPPRAVLAALAAGGRIPESIDVEELEEEMLVGGVVAEDRERQEAEDRAREIAEQEAA